MATTPAHTLTLHGVLSESNRIITAHLRHFLALLLLFLLPLSSAVLLLPSLHLPNCRPDLLSTSAHHHTFISPQTLTLTLYTLLTHLLYICALATITQSTHNGFHGRSVNLLPAIRSIISSFFPIVSTAIAARFFLFLISLSFVMFAIVIVKLTESLGFEIHYDSAYFHWFCGFLGVVLSSIIVYFQVIWGLASVIAVTESKWGFGPLRRSSYLINGMRSVSLSLLLVFGVSVGLWGWIGIATNGLSDLDLDFGVVDGWGSWGFVLRTIVTCGFLSLLTVLLLYYIAAKAVLYMYCKALRGELAVEIAEEFAREYVCLPFDDSKVPHVVTVVVSA